MLQCWLHRVLWVCPLRFGSYCYQSNSRCDYSSSHLLLIDPTIRAMHSADFDNLEGLINRFTLFLGSLRESHAQHSVQWTRNIAMTQCLTRFAMMQLHYPWNEEDVKSAAKVMSATKSIVDTVRTLMPTNLQQVDPLLPVLLPLFSLLTPAY